MEILKKTGIESQEGAVPKIIETPKFLIINNQLYDKNTFEPLKLDILDYGDLNFSSWGPVLRRSINTCCNVGNNYFQLGVNNLHFHMIEDSDYPDIFYLISQKGNCGSWFRAYKECVDKETGKHYYERLMNHTLGEYFNAYCNMIYYGGDYEIFYQNSDYIFGKCNEPHGVDGSGWSNWGTNYNHLFKLSKSTYTFTLLQSVHGIGDASYNHYFLKHDSAYDYVYVQYMAEHYVQRYDNLNTRTVIYTNNETGVNITGNPVQINGCWYYYVDEFKRTGSNAYQLCKIKVNQDDVEHEYIDIEGKEKMDLETANATMANVVHVLIHESKTICLDNGNNYIITIARSPANGTWYKTQHKLVVLKIEQDKAVVKQVINFSDDPCKGVLSYYEEEGHADFIITLHENSLRFWKFDYEDEKYYLTYIKIGTFYWFGLDELSRIYMVSSNSAIEIINHAETVIAKACFKQKVVEANQNTVVLSYWTKDYFNEYTSEQVNIRLSDGLEFQDGTVQKVLTTSAGGPTDITLNIRATSNVKAEADISVCIQ